MKNKNRERALKGLDIQTIAVPGPDSVRATLNRLSNGLGRDSVNALNRRLMALHEQGESSINGHDMQDMMLTHGDARIAAMWLRTHPYACSGSDLFSIGAVPLTLPAMMTGMIGLVVCPADISFVEDIPNETEIAARLMRLFRRKHEAKLRGEPTPREDRAIIRLLLESIPLSRFLEQKVDLDTQRQSRIA